MGFLSLVGSCLPLPFLRRRKDKISALPEDLLLNILLFLPTKDAVATTILSKRWRYVWTMLPVLEFEDEDSESNGWFIDKSLQLHKAPKLGSLTVNLGPRCPADVDVGNWVEKAVHHHVKSLEFKLLWTAEPKSFPKSLYTCDTLVRLVLSDEILVDVSFPASLPSLLSLTLSYVVYKDDDSLVRLLSSSPVLKSLTVLRHKADNLKNITVKVSSLERLLYDLDDLIEVEDDHNHIGSLVIDSPALRFLDLLDVGEDYCLIKQMPCLDEAYICQVTSLDKKFMRFLSSVKHLQLLLTQPMAACCNAINFSQLIEFYLWPRGSANWLEQLVLFLGNSPKLKTLKIQTWYDDEGLPAPIWNQPSIVPGCLSSHLEIVRWNGYGGTEDEKQLLTYILAYSKCLKTMEISLLPTCNLEEGRKEIESMPRISSSSQLLFPTEIKFSFA